MIFVSSNCHDEGLGRALSPVLGRALHSQLGRALLANGIHGFIPGAIERALYVQVMATLKKKIDVSPHGRSSGTVAANVDHRTPGCLPRIGHR